MLTISRFYNSFPPVIDNEDVARYSLMSAMILNELRYEFKELNKEATFEDLDCQHINFTYNDMLQATCVCPRKYAGVNCEIPALEFEEIE